MTESNHDRNDSRQPRAGAGGDVNKIYRPVLNKELLEQVRRPLVQSLLYDADLLPEQLLSQKEMTIGLFAAYNRLEGVLLAFKYLELQGIEVEKEIEASEAAGDD